MTQDSESSLRILLIDDDRLLFTPPDSLGTEPASIELLPPGPGMIVSARLASLHRSEAGVSIATMLGPDIVQLFGLALSMFHHSTSFI